MSFTVFPSSKPDWANLEVLHRGTVEPRASFDVYTSPDGALACDGKFKQSLCLSGQWKFHLSPNPYEVPDVASDLSVDNWSDIAVPGMWQLQGFGDGPQYTNVKYPFPVDPPNPPVENNETGTYVRSFKVPDQLKGGQLRIRFEGVDSAFHVWVNGVMVGYSQGSRNPAEFDVTSDVEKGKENQLVVRVYQRCDGSYIEDQDEWWLSGIFRDVHLISFAKDARLEDFKVTTTFDSTFNDAVLELDIKLSAVTAVEVKLLDATGSTILSHSINPSNSSTLVKLPITKPHKWSAETPYLYDLLLSLPNSNPPQHITQKIGFRSIQIVDGVFKVNGNPIIFRGVNRHEHHPEFGRTVPLQFMRNDLLLMKRNNINAIRTSHQPNDVRMYDLADELGFWVIDEADLECHGFLSFDAVALPEEELKELEKNFPNDSPRMRSWRSASKWTSDNPDWREAYLDRAQQMVARDKNHPCIIMWSLGNESYYGSNHVAMYDLVKKMDPSRPIHYEGDWEHQVADMVSEMYSPVEKIVDFAKSEERNSKGELFGLVLCEFLHAMGNGPGGMHEYIEAFYQYPRLWGGFVWEWNNHGIKSISATGQEFMAFGGGTRGDDDAPHDREFVFDGLVFSNHTDPTPALAEYAKAIEPVQVVGGNEDGIEIINRYDVASLDHLALKWSITIRDGVLEGGTVALPLSVLPHQRATVALPGLKKRVEGLQGDVYLNIKFTLLESTNWAERVHQVAASQIELQRAKPLERSVPTEDLPPTLYQQATKIVIHGTAITWTIDLVSGLLVSWVKDGIDVLSSPPTLGFYRPTTDNDAPVDDNAAQGDAAEWNATQLALAKPHMRSVAWRVEGGVVEVVTVSRIAPPILQWSVESTTTYRFSQKEVHINVQGKPKGAYPSTFARIGFSFAVHPSMSNAKWFGRGPGEAYSDSKQAQMFGTWVASVDELWTDYERPQENGNRTDVRTVSFENNEGSSLLSASFGDLDGASFSASHYKLLDIHRAQYPYLLRQHKLDEVVVRLDFAHHGLGSGSCGPRTYPKYRLNSGPFEYDVVLS